MYYMLLSYIFFVTPQSPEKQLMQQKNFSQELPMIFMKKN